MLYYLFEYLQSAYDFPGAGLFQYISFRAAMAIITSLLVSLVFGGRIINVIRNKQIGESVRELHQLSNSPTHQLSNSRTHQLTNLIPQLTNSPTPHTPKNMEKHYSQGVLGT